MVEKSQLLWGQIKCGCKSTLQVLADNNTSRRHYTIFDDLYALPKRKTNPLIFKIKNTFINS